jgi:branched-chain amino acid aminotransferase
LYVRDNVRLKISRNRCNLKFGEIEEDCSQMTELLIYLDGKFVPKSEAKVSVYDHGFLYGDGVFEGIRAYNGRVFKLKEHVDRLYDSAKAIAMDIPLTKDEMTEIILETLRKNNLKDAYIRPIVSKV